MPHPARFDSMSAIGIDQDHEIGSGRTEPALRWTDLAGMSHSLGSILRNALIGLFWHDGVMVASGIAFSLMFALFPFLIFLVALAAAVGGQQLGDYMSREALEVLPDHMVRTLEPELKRIFATENKTSLLTFGLLVTLISITGSVEAVRDGLNRAYRCSEERGVFRRYGMSLLFVVATMLFVLVLATLGFVVPVWIRYVEAFWPEFHLDVATMEVMRQLLLVVVMALMLGLTHLLLPARRRKVKSVALGALVTLVFWWASGRLFGMYLTHIANYSATYAGLGGIIALMFFLYIQSVIFIFGAELNRSISEWRGRNQLCRKSL